jgi:two-component system sensor histidine kinase RegB
MAVALALTGGMVAYFVRHVAEALNARQKKIALLERERHQTRVATTLGALAAGAAHELGTPLGTVRLLSEEMLHATESERAEISKAIDQAVLRMKDILMRMSSSELRADVLEPDSWDLPALVDSLSGEIGPEVRFSTAGEARVRQPLVIVLQIVRELLTNARKAAPGKPIDVILRTRARDGEFSVEVRDRGARLPAEHLELLFEPFVSFSGGRGLGLFLSRIHARQLGGDLHFEELQSGGLALHLTLPLELRNQGRVAE